MIPPRQDDVPHEYVTLPSGQTIVRPVITAKKFDNSKPPLALIPAAAMEEEAKAFADGREKYGQWNFKSGLEVTRTLSAAMRHIEEVLKGGAIDPDSKHGCHHLGAARAELAMALDTLLNHPEFDDRFKCS